MRHFEFLTFQFRLISVPEKTMFIKLDNNTLNFKTVSHIGFAIDDF